MTKKSQKKSQIRGGFSTFRLGGLPGRFWDKIKEYDTMQGPGIKGNALFQRFSHHRHFQGQSMYQSVSRGPSFIGTNFCEDLIPLIIAKKEIPK